MINTSDDKMMTNDDKMMTNDDIKLYKCVCGYETKHRQLVYRHKKTCKIEKEKSIELQLKTENEILKKELENKDEIIKLLKSQLENQNKLLEKLTSTHKQEFISVDTSNNVVNKNTFNITTYLNETCKNAYNIEEFIENYTIPTYEDLKCFNSTLNLEKILGKAIGREIKKLQQFKSPLVASCSKKEQLYFKYNNVWNKYDEKILKYKFVERIINIYMRKKSQLSKELIKDNSAMDTIFSKITIKLMSEYDINTLVNGLLEYVVVKK